jgi:hypothetical protein
MRVLMMLTMVLYISLLNCKSDAQAAPAQRLVLHPSNVSVALCRQFVDQALTSAKVSPSSFGGGLVVAGTLKGYSAIILCYDLQSQPKSGPQSIAVFAVSGPEHQIANRLIELLLEYFERAEKIAENSNRNIKQ